MEEETRQPEGITIQDFAKVELRVGRVKEASDHPNADRLLVLKVDLREFWTLWTKELKDKII